MNTIELTEQQKEYINSNAKIWIEQLMFDDIPQTTESLQDDFGYCCLGVGCKVYEETKYSLLKSPCGKYNESTLENHYSIVESFLGLHSAEGAFDNSGILDLTEGCGCLYELNDNLLWSFPQIAQFMLDYCHLVFIPVKEQNNS